MTRMDKVRSDQAKSLLSNVSRRFHLECISKGVVVPGLEANERGFYRVSYHHAGVASAWVQQTKIRATWPNLKTHVVDVSQQPCEWNAEIWVKRKDAN